MPKRQPNKRGGRKLVLDEQHVDAGPADVQPAPQFVRVTEELKRAATAALTAFASLHLDDIAEAHIEAVSLKHDGIEAAEAVAKAAKRLAEFFAQRHWQMQKVPVEVEADGEHGRVNLPWDLVLPGYFNTLVADAAQTELDLLEIDAWLVEAARLFCATFPPENLIRVDLVPREEECKSPECLECEKVVPALLKALREFAAALIRAAVTGPHHVVTITGKELSELEIKRDGEVVQFGKKNAPLRALLAFALLRSKPTFSTKELTHDYLGESKCKGKKAAYFGKTFNNAIRELRKFCPQVTYQKKRGQRLVSGLVFKSMPAEAVVREILHLLYRE